MQNNSNFFAVVTGIMYPGVQAGDGPAQKRLPEPDPDRNYYHHPTIKVCEGDVKKWQNLRGKPLRLEHGHHQGSSPVEVGRFVDSVLTKDNNLFVAAGIYDTEAGRYAKSLIDEGVLTGFSIGYDPVGDADGYLLDKVLHEGSLVIKPFFKGANISVCASDSQQYNNEPPKNDANRLFVPFVMQQQQQQQDTPSVPPSVVPPSQNTFATPAAPAAPAAQQVPASSAAAATQQGQQGAHRDAAAEIQMRALELELKQLRDERVREAKEKSELESKYREQEQFTKKYLDERQKQREVEEAKELSLAKDAMARIQKGLGAEQLPPEYVEQQLSLAQKKVYTEQGDPAKNYLDVAASMTQKIAGRFSEFQDRNQKLEDEVAKLKEELQNRDKRLLSVADRLNQTATTFGGSGNTGASNTLGTVAASGTPASAPAPLGAKGELNMTELLVVPKVQPNSREGYMYQRLYGMKQPMSVQASFEATSTVSVPAPPVHDKLEHCPNSLRFRKDAQGNPVGAAYFSTVVGNWRSDMKSGSSKFAVYGDMKTEHTF